MIQYEKREEWKTAYSMVAFRHFVYDSDAISQQSNDVFCRSNNVALKSYCSKKKFNCF